MAGPDDCREHMFKRIGVVVAAAMVAVGAFVVPASAQPEPRFTLEINPDEGPVGTEIQAQLPAEAFTPGGECLSPNEAFAGIQALVAALVASGDIQDPLQATLAAIANGALQTLGPDDIDLTFFYVLIFADPATQRPAIDETTGEESATSFWDPQTGQGSIVAPPAQRPKLYFVAGVCLDLNTNIDPAAAAAALAEIIQDTPGLATCLASADPPACVGAAAEAAIITLAIDQNPEIAWVAPFCLLGDNGENCAVPANGAGAAEPVAGEPRFTG